MSHTCYEGDCASSQNQPTFPTTRGLRTHQNRCHSKIAEEETSLGNARALKRKRDAEDEARKRQHLELEALLALEATNRELELQPVCIDNIPLKRYKLIWSPSDPTVGTFCRHRTSTFGEEQTASRAFSRPITSDSGAHLPQLTGWNTESAREWEECR